MGERVCVEIFESVNPEAGRTFLYSHWRGPDMLTVVHRALSRRERWTDFSYLARIVFSEMIETEANLKEGTGFGICYRCPGDLNYPLIRLNMETQVVTAGNHSWGFRDFIKLSHDEVMRIWEAEYV